MNFRKPTIVFLKKEDVKKPQYTNIHNSIQNSTRAIEETISSTEQATLFSRSFQKLARSCAIFRTEKALL